MIVYYLVILLFSIIVHEYAHGYIALRCGDPTAQYLGRLTFDPRPHIDPVGSILLPLILVVSNAGFLFGWAKPVPVNPNNFNDPRLDHVKVAAAGPASNILLAFLFYLICYAGTIFLPTEWFIFIKRLCIYAFIINLILAFFNLIPIPPLDGSKILNYFLPQELARAYYKLEKYGFVILLLLFVLTPLPNQFFGQIFRFSLLVFSNLQPLAY